MKKRATAEMVEAPVYHIRPSSGWPFPNLRELWAYRELLYFFVWRDLKVRYKQSVIGGLWAVIQPLVTMVVFTIIFGNLANIPSEGVPYPIFAYSGLVPWAYFSSSINQVSSSVVSQRNLITKVSFPRLIIPISSVLSGLPDFAISFSVLLLMMLYYRIVPTAAILLLPFLLFVAMATAVGIGLWVAAVNAIYRDVYYVVPFVVQLWMFASPVVYPSSLIPQAWRMLYGLNPMAGVLEGFRWVLLGTGSGLDLSLVISTIAVLIVLVTGLFYFRRMERVFADLV